MHILRAGGCFRGRKYGMRTAALVICLAVLMPILLAGCGSDEEESVSLADYGEYGSEIARTLCSQYPYRKAYSQGEKDAGAYIKGEMEKLGYTVEEQSFTSADGSGASVNYIVRIPGEGMMTPDENGEYREIKRQVIVGAHYDTSIGSDESGTYPNFDGIQDNASGIGCLMTLAKQMKGQTFAYDVILVAFGAGDASYAGAAFFASQMTAEEIASTDAMYCVESIYAGDKLYASAGWNSIAAGQKYDMRRKLYEAYDLVYENQLSSVNGVDLLYNESGISLDVNGDGTADVYREVTTTLSDYAPFDKAGIPIVFIESYDYNYSDTTQMKETKNLNLQVNGGQIRRTDSDSLETLEASLPEGQLSLRINNAAFILLKAIEKGAHDAISKTGYEAGETVAPTVHISVTVTPVPVKK